MKLNTIIKLSSSWLRDIFVFLFIFVLTSPAYSNYQTKEGSNQHSINTYNFYFQKAPTPQNKFTQNSPEDSSEPKNLSKSYTAVNASSFDKKSKPDLLNLSLGPVLLPTRVSWGFGISATLFPEKVIGTRISGFASFRNTVKEVESNQFNPINREREYIATLYGGDISLSLNLIRAKRIRISPLGGISIIHESKFYPGFYYFYRDDQSQQSFYNGDRTNSQLHLNPFLGLESTLHFNEYFGICFAISMPLTLNLMTLSIGTTLRI